MGKKGGRSRPPRSGASTLQAGAAEAGGPRWGVGLSGLPLLALLTATVLALTLGFLWNEDFWWYLASGEEILRQGGLPERDPFLFTSDAEAGWQTHSWLWTVVVALVHRAGGLPGVVVFGALLSCALIALVFSHRRVDRFGLVNGVLAAVIVATAAERMSLKTELVTWLLLVVFFYVLEARRPFGWRTFAVLAVLQWAWANLHAGYPLGVGIVLAYSLGGWIEERWAAARGRAGEERAPRPPLWAAPALFAVSLLTPLLPHRLGMLGAVLQISATRLAGERGSVPLGELQPTFAANVDLYALVYVGVLAVTVLSFSFNRGHARRLARLFLVAGMAVVAATAIRHVTGLAVVGALVTCCNLAEGGVGRRGRGGRAPALYLAAAAAFGLFLLAATAGLWLLRSDFEAGQSEGRFFTISPLAAAPGAADFVLEHELPGPVFNDLMLGGYLIHRLYPRYQLFIDNRVLRSSLVREYQGMASSPQRWRAAERRYGFRTAILTNLSVPSPMPLRSALAADRRWRLVYLDPLSAVFIRDPSPPAPVSSLTGEDGEVPFLTPESGPGSWLRWAGSRFFRDSPGYLLAKFLSVLGEYGQLSEAARLASRALEVRPRHAAILRTRGAARFLLGDTEAGLEDLRRAVQMEPADPKNHQVLARALEDSGHPDEAARELAEARRLRRDDSP